jgi:hypothetical protein
MLSVEITALEYSTVVYTDESLSDSPDTPGSGVPVFGGSGTLPAPSAPTFTSINTVSNTFVINTIINPNSGPVDEVRWFYSVDGGTSYFYLTNEVSSGGFTAGGTVSDFITQLPNGNYYFKAQAGRDNLYGDFSLASSQLNL